MPNGITRLLPAVNTSKKTKHSTLSRALRFATSRPNSAGLRRVSVLTSKIPIILFGACIGADYIANVSLTEALHAKILSFFDPL